MSEASGTYQVIDREDNSNVVNQAVLEQIREGVAEQSGVRTLSSGIRVELKPVSPKLIQEVISRIKNPKVPVYMNEDKGREEENPNDPDYLEQVEQAKLDRSDAAIDVILVEGVELLDKMPPLEEWLRSLRFLEKKGHFKLPDDIDWEDEFEVQYVYKKYKALGGVEDMRTILHHYRVSEEDIAQADSTFPDN